MLPQDTTHVIQIPCYQWGSPCQDPAGNFTTWRPDLCKETQTAVVWSCLLFIRCGQNHLARHSERGKKTRQTEEEMGRQHQGLELAKSQRALGNREKWRKLIAKSSVVPQQPSWLRDKWDERECVYVCVCTCVCVCVCVFVCVHARLCSSPTRILLNGQWLMNQSVICITLIILCWRSGKL